MRALQRETGVSAQRAADLRERLNFQCFKYELLVDMVCISCLHNLSSCAHHKCSSLRRAVLVALHHVLAVAGSLRCCPAAGENWLNTCV